MSEMEDVEEIIQKLDRVTSPAVRQTASYQRFIQQIRDDKPEPGHEHVRGAPILEFFSIIIKNTHKSFSDNPEPIGVSGTVQFVKQKDGSQIDLFKRKYNDPCMVKPGDTLPLRYSHVGPIIPSSGDTVVVHLKDTKRKLEIAKGVFRLHYSSFWDYDKVEVVKVEGKDGNAIFIFTTFLCGVVANIEVVQHIRKNDDGSTRATPDACVDIIARRCKFYESSTKSVTEDDLSVMLFDNRIEGYAPQESGTPIQLSKPWVSVPAYSRLLVKLHLWDRFSKQFLGEGFVEFEPSDDGRCYSEVSVHNFDFTVKVTWSHPFEHVVERRIPYILRSSAKGKERKMTSQKNVKRLRMHTHQQADAYFSELSAAVERNSLSLFGFSSGLIEIFSVIVGPRDGNVLKLYGSIEVIALKERMYMFNKEKDSPEVLPPYSNNLAVAWPCSSFQSNKLFMRVNLKDEMDRVIGLGSMNWQYASIHGRVCWYDKPICSIVRGDHGYVAFYYSIFQDAVQAYVTVTLVANSSKEQHVSVHGKITARYSEYDYQSEYELENYQNVLFAKTMDNCEKLTCGGWECGSRLSLSKYMVSVPITSLLIVGLDLEVSLPTVASCVGDTNSHVRETLVGKMVFAPVVHDDDLCNTIHGHGYKIKVDVEWRERNSGTLLRPLADEHGKSKHGCSQD